MLRFKRTLSTAGRQIMHIFEMIANNAQSTASMINELCIANSTFDAWIGFMKSYL